MLCYREMPRPGNIPAPADFTEELRRETGCADLFVWWEPELMRTVIQDGGTRKNLPGCWVVWARVQGVFGRGGFQWTDPVFVDVYKLDGEYGCPTGLGPWVWLALNQSDNTKRGHGVRQKELNDINEEAYLKPRVEMRTFAEDLYRDSFTKKVHQMHADKVGVTSRTKEEVNVLFKKLEKMQAEKWKMYEAEAKEMRVYQER